MTGIESSANASKNFSVAHLEAEVLVPACNNHNLEAGATAPGPASLHMDPDPNRRFIDVAAHTAKLWFVTMQQDSKGLR